MPSGRDLERADRWGNDPGARARRIRRMRAQAETGLPHPAELADQGLDPTGRPVAEPSQDELQPAGATGADPELAHLSAAARRARRPGM